MSLKMSEKSREEVLILMRERYKKRGRKGRSKLIDDFCAMCGYERKYAIKLLGSKRRVEGKSSKKGGAHAKYGDAEATVLKTIWQAAEQPCKIRLKAALPLWLPHYEAEHGGLEAELRERLLARAFSLNVFTHSVAASGVMRLFKLRAVSKIQPLRLKSRLPPLGAHGLL